MLEWLGYHPLGLSLERLRSWNRNYEEPFSLGKSHRTSLTSAHTLVEEGPCHHPPCYLFSLFHVEKKVGVNITPSEVIQFNGEGPRGQFGVTADTGKVVACLPSVNLPVLWFEQLSEQMSSWSIFLKHPSVEFASKHFIILILTTKHLLLNLWFSMILTWTVDTTLSASVPIWSDKLHHLSRRVIIRLSVLDWILRGGPHPLLIPVPILILAQGECCSHSSKGHLHNRALLIDLKTCIIWPSLTLFISKHLWDSSSYCTLGRICTSLTFYL